MVHSLRDDSLPSIQNYLFIDGSYLRRSYEDTMRKFFTDVDAANLSLTKIKTSAQASKGFFYDCVDETATDGGSKQKAWLDHIRSLPGFHIRQGTISRHKIQKQVDVQLAVDMLTHAFNKNIWHATLIAGDLDFKPLVDALINLGVHLHIYYDPQSASRPLYHAADVSVPMTIQTYWHWSSDAHKKAHPAPTIDDVAYAKGDHPLGIHTLDFQGVWNNRPIRLYGIDDRQSWAIHLPQHDEEQSITIRRHDKDALLKYFDLVFGGEITWNK
jgi:uncharacterized LabA/DUF88 family protein